MRDRFFIVDTHGFMYRALYKRGAPLTSSSGEPTRGTYYFCRMLFSLVDHHKPEYMALVLDAPRDTTWRRSIYPPYKDNRDKGAISKEHLIQIKRIQQIIRMLGIAVVEAPTHEADDLIASLVDTCASDAVQCVIVTRDKDLHQLVSKNCIIYDPQDEVWIDEKKVYKHWGVTPRQVVEMQTLTGDRTDNVPGVVGIGPKKALQLVRSYGTVEKMVEAVDTLPPSIQKAFKSADLRMCRKLVELRRDAPLSVDSKDLEFNGFAMKKLRPLFRELGFRAWS